MRKKNRLPPFVPLFRDMLKHPVWLDLSNSAKVAYVYIKAKCFSDNPGELSLSYNEIEAVMQRQTYAKALRELEDHGFIEMNQKGGLFRKRNFFRLSENWRKYQVGKCQPQQVGNIKLSKTFMIKDK